MSSADFDSVSSEGPLMIVDPAGLDCVLAAGDAGDIAELTQWCNELPPGSYGNVFIEVFSPIQIRDLDLPPTINVTWLCRERSSGGFRPGLGEPRGGALATAVDAWMNEWWRVDQGEGRHLCVWAGARSSSVMQSYWMSVENEIASRKCQRRARRDEI